jgi:hypothetical protein
VSLFPSLLRFRSFKSIPIIQSQQAVVNGLFDFDFFVLLIIVINDYVGGFIREDVLIIIYQVLNHKTGILDRANPAIYDDIAGIEQWRVEMSR